MCWDKTQRKWMATIAIAGKMKHIGTYDDETEAARAYDATVRAQSLDKPLNFPDDLSTAPGVYVPKKKKRVASSRFRGATNGEEESDVGVGSEAGVEMLSSDEGEEGDGSVASASRVRPSPYASYALPDFTAAVTMLHLELQIASLLQLASLYRRLRVQHRESRRRGFVGCRG